MKRNSRLSLALHTLGHMATEPEIMSRSTDIASHAGTNPVVVRRVLGYLRQAGLLISEKGRGGGWRLARSPHHITLADVYLAVQARPISDEKPSEHCECTIEKALGTRLTTLMDEIEQTLLQRLSETTIAELASQRV